VPSFAPTSTGSLDTVNTPCLVLDRRKLQRNLERIARIVSGRGVRLRPHLKTAKSLDVTRLAAPCDDDPVAVSTLVEAEYFAAHGYRDIFYPIGLPPGKFARAIALLRRGVRLMTCVDSPDAARRLAQAAQEAGVMFRTTVEIDCGDHRGGLAPDSADVSATARALGTHFAGVSTHGGQSYDGRTVAERDACGQAEADALRLAAARLAAEGVRCDVVSVGSSPTAVTRNDLSGITELRAGVYMFGDLYQAAIETCTRDDIAISVLAEVIGRQPGRSNFLIDAGAFALSKDLATASLPLEQRAGYGLVCDLDGRIIPGLRVERVWQEHGLVVSGSPLAADAFPVGTRVRVLPNHACPTAAAHAAYQVVDGDRAIVATWPRVNGW
jgi:D-serine deaminase-like pyridoxal phosphate-dependent protein